MENNKLVVHKESIFTKIVNIFKKFFKKNEVNNNTVETINYNTERKEKSLDYLKITEDEETGRLKRLKNMYDSGEIEEEEISDEDIEKIVKLYEEETKLIKEDTERRKNHIAKMLKELKSA